MPAGRARKPQRGGALPASLRLLSTADVSPTAAACRFSITALEQGCQRCWRDVYARMYADEASRVAEWLTGGLTGCGAGDRWGQFYCTAATCLRPTGGLIVRSNPSACSCQERAPCKTTTESLAS